MAFPTEYKEIINRYGSGIFGEFLIVLHPFENSNGYDWNDEIKGIISADSYMREQGLLSVESCLCSQDLFPIAVTDNGDTLYFNKNLENSLYLYDSRRGNQEVYNIDVIEFLITWLNGSLSSKIIDPPKNLSFQNLT